MNEHYDIFISYKRKSLPTANNLYYRLTTRGYSTFFDLEEMGRDNFNVQLLKYIKNVNDVFVILEEGSLDGCKSENWEEEDWFCHEIAFALENKKNIIPILLNGYQMPSMDYFPDKLKELSLKNAPEFNFSFFEAYIDKLIKKQYLISKPSLQEKATSVFKFYSNENCQVFKEGKLVCSLVGMSDEPYYLPVYRKGDYRFKAVNQNSNEVCIKNVSIDLGEEKNIEIIWKNRNLNQGNHKGYSIAVCVALIVLFLLGILQLKSFFNQSAPIDSSTIHKNERSSGSEKVVLIDDIENYSSQENSIHLTAGDFVDLGLSVNWASRNVGATTPEGAGGYYAWGETKEKEEYSIETYAYKYSEYGYTHPKKIASDISGTKYDAARVLLEEGSRMPTRKEMKELIMECDWHFWEINGISGMVVTGKNGNCIFIPAVGSKKNMATQKISFYWTSTAGEYGTPYCLYISAFSRNAEYDLINFVSVEYGLPIRPVVSK